MRSILFIFLLLITLSLGYLGYQRFQSQSQDAARSGDRAAPAVEVAAIETATIELRRRFSGSLESPSFIEVSARVDGRLKRLVSKLGDKVEKGQVIAVLEEPALALELKAAEADLQVGEASLYEAQNDLEIAERDLKRATSLMKGGIESQAALDNAQARQLRAAADVRSAEARLARARADLEQAQVQVANLEVRADWYGDGPGVVAEQFVNQGSNISVNQPLIAIVAVDPLRAVIYVTEQDYGLLSTGQQAHLRTDAYPGESFPAQIARLAPSFSMASRQARIELEVNNAAGRLAPGMFATVEILLEQVQNATVVPYAALVNRDDEQGVFLLMPDQTVKWQPVEVGIRQGERVQIKGVGLTGEVVTLGQQMLSDGIKVNVPSLMIARLLHEPAAV